MSEEEQKRWKEDAKQLKADLDSRQKVIQRREIEIKFPKQSSKPKPLQEQSRPKSTKTEDDFLRRNLGL